MANESSFGPGRGSRFASRMPWRYGGAGLVGAAAGAYLGGDTQSSLIGGAVGVGGYGLYRHRAAALRMAAPVTAGIGKRIPQGVKSAFRSGGRLLGKAFIGLEAVMIASDMKEGRGMAQDVYEAYNRNDPIGAVQGVAGGLGSYAMTGLFLGWGALALLPVIAAKET